jgi:hypothetical protein
MADFANGRAPEGDNALARAVKSETFAITARAAMVFATMVGLPIAGWMMNRVTSAIDGMNAKVDLTSEQVKLLQQSINLGVNFRIDGAERQLSDHEVRIRGLERQPHSSN